MPGTYAHLTLVNLVKEPHRLEAAGVPGQAIGAVLDWFRYCELGAVSPDYPYLDVMSEGAKHWADAMHYTRTGEVIQAGVRRLAAMQGEVRQKLLAWLLGYTAHVGADVTIHPVVELKVGPYAQNTKGHRICEMHQDAYIFQRLNLGEVGLSEHLKTGIGLCSAPGDKSRLDVAVRQLWTGMLADAHPQETKANPPNMDSWHAWFGRLVDGVAEEGYRLVPLARHVAAESGLTYPLASEVNRAEYIDWLKTPVGFMSYDDLFDRAVVNVARLWAEVARGVFGMDEGYRAALGNWNLDTGRDAAGHLVMWRNA